MKKNIAVIVFFSLALFFFVSQTNSTGKEYKATIENNATNKITILTRDCYRPGVTEQIFTVEGQWNLKSGKFDCREKSIKKPIEAFTIYATNGLPRSIQQSKDRRLKTIEVGSKYKKYSFGYKGKDDFEVIVFDGFDGNLIYVESLTKFKDRKVVYRLLNSDFELRYSFVSDKINDEDIFNLDKIITTYVRSITMEQ